MSEYMSDKMPNVMSDYMSDRMLGRKSKLNTCQDIYIYLYSRQNVRICIRQNARKNARMSENVSNRISVWGRSLEEINIISSF